MNVLKSLTQPTVLLLAVALIVFSIVLASGSGSRVSIEIHSSLPDIRIQIEGPTGSKPVTERKPVTRPAAARKHPKQVRSLYRAGK
jgi:hypothetical protein